MEQSCWAIGIRPKIPERFSSEEKREMAKAHIWSKGGILPKLDVVLSVPFRLQSIYCLHRFHTLQQRLGVGIINEEQSTMFSHICRDKTPLDVAKSVDHSWLLLLLLLCCVLLNHKPFMLEFHNCSLCSLKLYLIPGAFAMISSRIALLNLILAFFLSDRISMYLFLRRTIHVVKRLSGEGATLVLCMFLISLASPNFHSMSDWKFCEVCRLWVLQYFTCSWILQYVSDIMAISKLISTMIVIVRYTAKIP